MRENIDSKKYINYKLTSEELKIYMEWGNKKPDCVNFQSDFREEILEYLKKKNDGKKIEEIGHIIYPILRRAGGASSSTQFSVLSNKYDELENKLLVLQKSINFLVNYFIQETGLENIKPEDKFFEMPNALKAYQNDLKEKLKETKKERIANGKKYQKGEQKNEYLGFKDTKLFTMDDDKLDYKDYEENGEQINKEYQKGNQKDDKEN